MYRTFVKLQAVHVPNHPGSIINSKVISQWIISLHHEHLINHLLKQKGILWSVQKFSQIKIFPPTLKFPLKKPEIFPFLCPPVWGEIARFMWGRNIIWREKCRLQPSNTRIHGTNGICPYMNGWCLYGKSRSMSCKIHGSYGVRVTTRTVS